jgi:Flp pilus assembly pilin Flp
VWETRWWAQDRRSHRPLPAERGTSAIEYAIIASSVSIVIAGTVATLGTAVKGLYDSVASALN